MEIWKEIDWSNGFYQVSNLGRVRSKERTYIRSNGRPMTVRGKLVPCHWSDGYMRVRLNVPGFPKWHTVHKLVLEAFVGPRPNGLVIRHCDGDQQNNRLDNLVYGSNAENQADRILHGTHNQGSITDEVIVDIRTKRANGTKLSDLQKVYGVEKTLISQICLGRIYERAGGPILKPNEIAAHRKITPETAAEIIKRRLAGEKLVPLAKEYGISHSWISKMTKESVK